MIYCTLPLLRIRGNTAHAAFLFALSFPLFGKSLSPDHLGDSPLLPEVTLFLKDEVTLDRPRIFLADISVCSGHELLCQETYGIEMGRFQGKSQLYQMSASKVKSLVDREWPNMKTSVKGASSVLIKLSLGAKSNDEIVRKLLERLSPIQKLGFDVEATKVSFAPLDQYSRLEPIGFDDRDLEDPTWIKKHLSGKSTFKLAAYDESSEEPLDTFDVEVWLTLKKSTVLAKDGISRGQTLTPQDLVIGSAAVNTVSEQFEELRSAEDLLKNLVGKVARVDIKRDQPVLLRQTFSPVAIKKNQIVNVNVLKSSLAVGFQGTSLQDGSIGDFIEIRSKHSKKSIRARVTGEHSAEISTLNVEDSL